MAIREPATFPRLTREDLTRTVVTPDDTRPLVGPADQCGYCESRLGEEHEAECVCRKRPVLVELRIRMVVDRPESWGKEEIEFQINDGSYCAGNLIQALAESDDVAHEWSCCDSCARTEAEFIRPATDEDIEFLALLRQPEGEHVPAREVVNVEAAEWVRRGDLVELDSEGRARRHPGMLRHHAEPLPPCTCGHPRSDHWSSGDPVPMCTACGCRRYTPERPDYRCDHRWYAYYVDREPSFRMCLNCCSESAVALAPAERATVATAKVAASPETDSLIAIIERLAGEVVPAADEAER